MNPIGKGNDIRVAAFEEAVCAKMFGRFTKKKLAAVAPLARGEAGVFPERAPE